MPYNEQKTVIEMYFRKLGFVDIKHDSAIRFVRDKNDILDAGTVQLFITRSHNFWAASFLDFELYIFRDYFI